MVSFGKQKWRKWLGYCQLRHPEMKFYDLFFFSKVNLILGCLLFIKWKNFTSVRAHWSTCHFYCFNSSLCSVIYFAYLRLTAVCPILEKQFFRRPTNKQSLFNVFLVWYWKFTDLFVFIFRVFQQNFFSAQ